MKRFLSAEDVSAALDISQSHAYRIIVQLNKELEAQGYHTVQGKVNRCYFETKYLFKTCRYTSPAMPAFA